MIYSFKEEKDRIIVTKKINRLLGIVFFILGLVFNLFFFSAYILVFIGQIDTITIIGTSFVVSSYLPLIDILFIIGGGLIVGAFYFCCWIEGWDTITTLEGRKIGIEFFSGVFSIRRKKFVSKDEINDLYIEKIPIDEIQSFFLYQIILKYQDFIKNVEYEKILIRDTDRDLIHSIGLKITQLLILEKDLVYKTVKREIF